MFYKISHHTADYNSLSINYLQTLVKKLKNKFYFVTYSLSIKKSNLLAAPYKLSNEISSS